MPEITPPPVPNEVPVATPVETTPEVDVDQQEWETAANEMFPERRKAEEPNTTTETTQAPAITEETTVAPDETKVDQPATPTQPTPDVNAITARMAQRQFAADVEAIRNDVKEKMFVGVDTLKDADGDPIKGPDDLLNLKNPNTGEAFTPEEAMAYWPHLQLAHQNQVKAAEAEIDRIANVNAAIKDEADVVNTKYGELLKSNPQLQQRIWEQFGKTLKVDPATQVILDAPVSLLEFYDAILQPHMEAFSAQQAAIQQQQEAARQAEEAQKQAEEAKKKQVRVDRSDIYGAGKADQMDEEEQEWANAAKAIFG